eukprot:TRINITY_DN10104_c0_g3_i1.p1 TRINITY_DN10104_c0_g3~~TRINITY_DN10104_c0_g3_i1.p1  ORF type:complete len:156 (+),score=33.74 TRINITY_DN10104_c0_g3_i1:48-470(+)
MCIRDSHRTKEKEEKDKILSEAIKRCEEFGKIRSELEKEHGNLEAKLSEIKENLRKVKGELKHEAKRKAQVTKKMMENIQMQKANEIKKRTNELKKSITESEIEADMYQRVIIAAVNSCSRVGHCAHARAHLVLLQEVIL